MGELKNDYFSRKEDVSYSILELKGNGNAQQENPKNESKESPLFFLGFNLSLFNKTWQFLFCSVGVFIFYIFYGYLQELIFTHREIKTYGLYVTFYQFILYSVFGWVEFKGTGHQERRISIKTYFLLALLTVGTMALSNSSLAYLNYPTQIIFKSCKLIPVLVGGIVIQKKQYGSMDFFAATVMCAGLIWFTLIDSHISPNFDITGIIMITFALLADAIIGNVQEKAMRATGAPNSEVVLYSYSIGVVYIFFTLAVSGQLMPAIHLCSQYRKECYGYGALYSMTGYLGINLVLTLVRTCGAFAAVTVTTFRKAFTMVLSFMMFSKPFSIDYVWAGALVFVGVYLNSVAKKPEWKDPFARFKAFFRSVRTSFVPKRHLKLVSSV